MKKRWVLLSIFGMVAVAIIFLLSDPIEIFTSEPKDLVIVKAISAGNTFGQLASEAGLATNTISAILEKSKNIYDLAAIRAGKELAFVFSALDNSFKKLIYQVDTENEFIFESSQEENSPLLWEAHLVPILYELQQKEIEAVIDASLYETFLNQDWDIRLALFLAEVFAWQIDFAADIQKGDTFKVIYEERYRDGRYVMPC